MGMYITHTVDDEEPDCNRCNHCCDNYDCSGFCGANHSWNGYSRTEYMEDE